MIYNSRFLDGLSVEDAKRSVIDKLEELSSGASEITYRLRDWGVSRQRYWGCPVPMIHCGSCGLVPVPEADLPVTLPLGVDFDKPGNRWTTTHLEACECPKCGGEAVRETDTFDTFFESSWYFARFCDAQERPRSTRTRRTTGCRWISISAASSMRSCTSCIHGSSPGR